MPDHLAPHQANRPIDRCPHRRRELIGQPTDLVDLGPDDHAFGHRPASDHDRKGRQEIRDPESMETELRAGQVEVIQAKTTHSTDSAAPLQSVDDYDLTATFEICERAEARNPGIEHR